MSQLCTNMPHGALTPNLYTEKLIIDIMPPDSEFISNSKMERWIVYFIRREENQYTIQSKKEEKIKGKFQQGLQTRRVLNMIKPGNTRDVEHHDSHTLERNDFLIRGIKCLIIFHV